VEYLCAKEASEEYLRKFQRYVQKRISDVDGSGRIGDGYIHSEVDWRKTLEAMDKHKKMLF
jgi:hypothetical protein